MKAISVIAKRKEKSANVSQLKTSEVSRFSWRKLFKETRHGGMNLMMGVADGEKYRFQPLSDGLKFLSPVIS